MFISLSPILLFYLDVEGNVTVMMLMLQFHRERATASGPRSTFIRSPIRSMLISAGG